MTLVCHLWSNIVRELIPLIIKDLEISEWILTQYPRIEVLLLQNQGAKFSRMEDDSITISNEALLRLTNLKELSLSSNAIIRPKTLKKLTSLTKLDLMSNKNITNSDIKDLTNLKWLCLYDNSRICDPALLKLTNLEYLDLSGTYQITNRPLKKLTKLTSLSTNCITTNASISLLTNLTYLSISSDEISNRGLEKLVNLRTLQFWDPIEGITYEGLSKLSKLDTLHIVSEFPDSELSRMTNLTSLEIRYNNNTDIGIQNLTNLKYLEIIEAHSITDFGIRNLTSLTYIELNHLITDEGIRNLTNLKILHLCGNQQISDYGLEKLIYLEKLTCFDKERCLQFISQIYLTKLVPYSSCYLSS